MQTYRVWMKDGYAGLYRAETEQEAKDLATKAAAKSIEGAAITARERREAVTVDYAERLT